MIFYPRQFYEYAEMPFEVPPYNEYMKSRRKPIPGAPKLDDLQNSYSDCIFFIVGFFTLAKKLRSS